MLVSSKVNRVAIIGSNRIPFSRSNSAYAEIGNQEMMEAALNGLVSKYKLEGKLLGEVAGGAVLKSSQDFNLIRECVLSTKLHPGTPGVDLQQACGTGLEAAIYIANKIALGQIEVGIAGGVDTTSQAPIMLNNRLIRTLMRVNRAKSNGDKFKAALNIKLLDFFKPNIPSNGEPRTNMSMGEHGQVMAKVYGITREDQDKLAFESHTRMAKAKSEGFFDDLITPFGGLDFDNNFRASTSLEKLSTLKPVFGKDGNMTAGNSTPLTDGASCVLLASEDWAIANGYEILAFIRSGEVASTEFVNAKENLLASPVLAVSRMLKKLNLSLQDFDFYEIHEAFAAQTLSTLKVWETPELSKKFGIEALGSIDRAKLNVNGSSLAAGHPFAATGGRILGVAAKLLNQKGSGRVLISVCAAGGQGVTAILEK